VYFNKEEDLMGQSDVHANMGLTYVLMDDFEIAEYHLLQEGRIDSLLESEWGLVFFMIIWESYDVQRRDMTMHCYILAIHFG
jgi:hypothetical protein